MQFRILVYLLVLFYQIVPFLIIYRIHKPFEKEIRDVRLKYSIPCFFAIAFNFIFSLYGLVISKHNIFTNNYISLILPTLVLIVVLISYSNGNIKERYIVAQIGASKVEDTRFGKGRSRKRVNMLSGINNNDIEKMEDKREEILDQVDNINSTTGNDDII
ncbi:MAG: hypothetical protein PHQ64_02835 [Bacilli bacterium]|nr:hypothetical protein [Bacilli bacterium]